MDSDAYFFYLFFTAVVQNYSFVLVVVSVRVCLSFKDAFFLQPIHVN